MESQNRVCIVSSGTGNEIFPTYAREGGNVVMANSNPADVQPVADDIAVATVTGWHKEDAKPAPLPSSLAETALSRG
jgi:hypothetical protein